MTYSDQFIFGDAKEIASHVKRYRWRECDHASWRTPDGTIVHHMDLPQQLLGIARGSTLHMVGFYDIDQMRDNLSHLHVVLYPDDWS